MGKTSETKNEILRLLASGEMRLADLYPKLGLSSATVIQHLKELERMGLVKKSNDPHFKNVKYYGLNKAATQNTVVGALKTGSQGRVAGMIILPAAVIVVAAIAVLVFFTAIHAASGIPVQSRAALEIMLTSSPKMPQGTQSINITYGPVYVHMNGTAPSDWVMVNKGGSVDLMSLMDNGTPIGYIQMPSNGVMDSAKFNMSAATIAINGTSYPLIIPNATVLASLGSGNSAETFGMLLDISPTISTLNGTSSVPRFVMTYTISVMRI